MSSATIFHQNEHQLCSKSVIEKHVFHKTVGKDIRASRLRRILSTFMIGRSLSSSIPFLKGKVIGDKILGISRKVILTN